MLLLVVADRVQVVPLQSSELLLWLRDRNLIIGSAMALIDEGSERLLLLLALGLDRMRCSCKVLFATVAAVAALVVQISLSVTRQVASLLYEVVLTRPNGRMGLVVRSAALNTFRL